MGFVVIIPFAALVAWVIFAIARWLRRGGYDRQWWQVFGIFAAAGLALGVWFAFFSQYKVANTHLEGFPIPIGIANRASANEPWSQSPMPVSIRVGGVVTDILSGLALCLVPIAIAAFFKENRGQPNANSPKP
jgi:hypothetical protein